MDVSSCILPVGITSCTAWFSPSKWVPLEKCRGFGCTRVVVAPIMWRNRRYGGHVLVRNSVLPDGTPIPSGSSGSWKGWILGLLITLVFPMWRSKLSPLALLKNKLDTAVQTAEDIADAVEEVAVRVDKLTEELSDHLPEGGKLRHAVDVIEDLAEETAKQAHLIGEVIDKVQEVEDSLEDLIEHPSMALVAGRHANKATDTVTNPEEVAEQEKDSSHGNGNESLSS